MDNKPFNKRSTGLLCLSSVILLILSFPKFNLSFFAFFALVPLMFALDGRKKLPSFWLAKETGFFFFLGTLYWFFHLTEWFTFIAIIGVILLLAVLSLYFGLFGLGYYYFRDRSIPEKAVLISSLWVAVEFLRANLFTGFGWLLMGHTMYRFPAFIQTADITGVYGISFVVVMANVFIKEVISVKVIKKEKLSADFKRAVAGFFVIVLLYLNYGLVHILIDGVTGRPGINVTLIQANTPQDLKWDEKYWPRILEEHKIMTLEALKDGTPDLVIWPETSLPGHLGEDEHYIADLKDFVQKNKIRLVFGSVAKEGGDYYNAAFRISEEGNITDRYNKIHLVPFGEFLPFRNAFPFLEDWVEIGDFSRGNQYTVFHALPHYAPFSVLICFEDTVPFLARRFVRGGAGFLVNITNDAWFGNSNAPLMHTQAATFRAVENRRYLVRAANTGISGFIDFLGRLQNEVRSGGKMTWVKGYTSGHVFLNKNRTVYAQYGDIFAFLATACVLWGFRKKKDK